MANPVFPGQPPQGNQQAPQQQPMPGRERLGVSQLLTNFGFGLLGAEAARTGQPALAEVYQQASEDANAMIKDRWFRREAEMFNQRVGKPMQQQLQQAFQEFQRSTTPIVQKSEVEGQPDRQGLPMVDPQTGQVVDVVPTTDPRSTKILQEQSAGLTNTYHQAIMGYLDEAAKFGNNPYINQSAQAMMNVVQQWAEQVSAGPQQAMEMRNQQIAQQQAEIQLGAARRGEEMAQARRSVIGERPGGVLGYQARELAEEEETREIKQDLDRARAEALRMPKGKGKEKKLLGPTDPIRRYLGIFRSNPSLRTALNQERSRRTNFLENNIPQEILQNPSLFNAYLEQVPQLAERETYNAMLRDAIIGDRGITERQAEELIYEDETTRQYSKKYWAEELIEKAKDSLESGERERAQKQLMNAKKVYPYHPDIEAVEKKVKGPATRSQVEAKYDKRIDQLNKREEKLLAEAIKLRTKFGLRDVSTGLIRAATATKGPEKEREKAERQWIALSDLIKKVRDERESLESGRERQLEITEFRQMTGGLGLE